MSGKRSRIKPSRRATGDPKEWSRRARAFSERLAASGRTFSDSTETVRADRNARA